MNPFLGMGEWKKYTAFQLDMSRKYYARSEKEV